MDWYSLEYCQVLKQLGSQYPPASHRAISYLCTEHPVGTVLSIAFYRTGKQSVVCSYEQQMCAAHADCQHSYVLSTAVVRYIHTMSYSAVRYLQLQLMEEPTRKNTHILMSFRIGSYRNDKILFNLKLRANINLIEKRHKDNC